MDISGGNRMMCHALRHGASAKCHLSTWSLASQPPLCSGTPYAPESTAREGIINHGDHLCLPGKVRRQERGQQQEEGQSYKCRLCCMEGAQGRVGFVSCERQYRRHGGWDLFKGEDEGEKMVCSCSIEWLRWWDLWENPNYCATGNTV